MRYESDARVTLAWGASCCFPRTHHIKRFFSSFFSFSSRLFPPSFLLIDVFLYMSSALQINRSQHHPSSSDTHTHARALTSDPRMQIRDVTVLIVLMNYSYVSHTLFVSLSRWGLWNTDLLFCFRTEPMIFTYTLFINPNTRTHLACLWSTRLPLWGHQETLDLCSWLLPVLTSVMQCVTWHAGFVLQQVSLYERMKWICLVFVASMLMLLSEGVAMATAGEERLFFCVCCHGD